MSRAIEQVFGTDPNDPTFPVTVNDEERNHVFTGLSKREHFAGLCMQGILANSAVAKATTDHPAGVAEVRRMVADAAVASADALLAELAKVTP